MGQIQRSVLLALDRIYDFVGGERTTRVDADLPVVLTHDVSREAERAAAIGPYQGIILGNTIHTHAAANTQRSVLDPYTWVFTLGLDDLDGLTVHDIDIWLLRMAVKSNHATFLTSAGSVLSLPSTFPGGNSSVNYWPVFYGEYSAMFADRGAAANQLSVVAASEANNATPNVFQVPFPLYIPYSGHLSNASVSGGGVQAEFCMMFWVGRKGTTPPAAP